MQPPDIFTLVSRTLAATALTGIAIVYGSRAAWPPAIFFGAVAILVWFLAVKLFVSKIRPRP